LETKKRDILLEREATWRLKSRAIWLKQGDENTKFFHNFVRHRHHLNTITHLQNDRGDSINGHSNLEELGVEHFQNIFHDDNQVSMAQLINIINIFPSYVTDEHNLSLQEVVSEAEVDEAIASMQMG
jgi:hypothetical protein